MESFRQRLNAVTREKYENEEKVIKLSEELEKKVNYKPSEIGIPTNDNVCAQRY